jgi:hypothetical protein
VAEDQRRTKGFRIKEYTYLEERHAQLFVSLIASRVEWPMTHLIEDLLLILNNDFGTFHRKS